MKTKFTSILKVRDLEVTKVENEISKQKANKRVLNQKLIDSKEEIYGIKTPSTGTILQMQSSQFQINTLRSTQKLILQDIENINLKIKLLEQKYKEAMLEYEKIKHLHSIEVEKILAKLKQQEAKDMDEIANQLFTRKNKKED